ncbi:MAG: hypothetical protein U0840_06840 [Gemmataceae bacterium]
MKRETSDANCTIRGIVGFGLDHQDDEVRITRADQVLLYGGSQETHAHMQDTAIYFNEELRRRGKRLEETSPEEVVDLLRRASDR